MYNNLIRFKGTLARKICDYDDFKMFAINIDKEQYPELVLSKYGNVTIQGDIFDLQYNTEYDICVENECTKYGYKVINISFKRPTTQEEMFIFLSEILTNRQAETLYNNYPDIVDRVKENRLDDIDLSKLKGIGEKTFKKIVNKIAKNFCLADLVVEFQGYISLNYIKKMYDKFTSIERLRYHLQKDPYKCLCSISGVGFKKADDMLLEIEKISNENIKNDKPPIIPFENDLRTSAERCKACLIYLLQENEKNGNTQMNLADLRSKCMATTKECVDKFTDVLQDKVFYYNKELMEVSLRSTYAKEYSISKTLINALNNNIIWDVDIEKYRTNNNCKLTDEQLSVLDKIRQYNVVILNGPAGSGKSASVQSILVMLKDLKKSYKLFAPTGRASKVISEYTNEDAMTIHRGLGFVLGEGFFYNAKNKLSSDVIIVDEFSMVDLNLMKHLIDAIDFTKTKLLMIGDNSQLPSVGCGNILHDLMQSEIIPTTTLTKIFRYSDGGLMKVATDVRLCQPYLTKNMKNKATTFGNNKDYTFIDIPDDKIVLNIVALYKKLLSLGKTVNDIQVLTSMKNGSYGSILLNNEIQKVANPNYGSDSHISIGNDKTSVTFYEGDLVIQTQNNYKALMVDKNGREIYPENDMYDDEPMTAFIANGEIGTIKEVYSSYIIIDFDGILIKYFKNDMADINLGYAITVYKSQGGSCNTIILATPKSHSFMLNSNLIYVGLTRMKKQCFHLGNINTVSSSIIKKANLNRNTFMQRLLFNMYTGVDVDVPYENTNN